MLYTFQVLSPDRRFVPIQVSVEYLPEDGRFWGRGASPGFEGITALSDSEEEVLQRLERCVTAVLHDAHKCGDLDALLSGVL